MHNKIIYKEDIVEFLDVFSKEECDLLINYFNLNEDNWNVTCFYESRVMDPFANMSISKTINHEYFEEVKNRLSLIASEVAIKKLKNLSFSAHKWNKGAYASDHSDNSELDGTPNAWQDNKFVAIIYLNDNYEGGNLTFSQHNLSIAPKIGSVIAFDPGFNNLHGVSEIIAGTRYTMLASFDYVDSVYTRDLTEWRKEYSKEQEEQRKSWKNAN
jgi:hypothetical protein